MISFFAHGDPKGQPRPRAFARKFGAKWQARVYDAGTAEGWKSQVALAVKALNKGIVIPDGPIRVNSSFYFRRPKSHFRTGKNAHLLRDDAPEWHTQKPDRDNLDKAVLDALTQLGCWSDDCQVCAGEISKRWAPLGSGPGCLLEIEPL